MKRVAIAMLAMLALGAGEASAATAPLSAGVGRADITPQLGYYLGGWTRADRTAQGQHTRLYAHAMVLQRGGAKVALVAVDLFMVPGGLVKHVGDALRDRGLSEQTILMSASHTHSGPGGFANYPTLNTAAPSMETATDPESFFQLLSPGPADPQLYRFLVEQITTAIRRADDARGPAVAGWGAARITGLTRNRSVEAHLNNHGITLARGAGSASMDPEGEVHTIDPEVDVLRVDRLVRRGGKRTRRPIGAWSVFANHGTVTKSTFEFYNADHHGSAIRVFEERVRRAAKLRPGDEVVNVYGNSNEGDMSAGLDHHGPAGSDYVGRVEAGAMFRAWRQAGRDMTRGPALDVRWTRICFCGQEVEGGGRVGDASQLGLPFLTGSEEERGPLFDVTQVHFEDVRSPVDQGPHGVKASAPGLGDVPNHVPLLAVRVRDRLIVSIPGEGTKEAGARIRAAVAGAVEGAGIERVVVSGVANEFVLYFTTPEEYDRQHYEGGNTHFGRLSSVLLQQQLAKLSDALVDGRPAPEPSVFDPTNGVTPDGPPYGEGAESASVVQQPSSVQRLERARMRWQGGPLGLDRPVDRAFVTAERRDARGRWVRYDDDLGLAMLWQVDDDGLHTADWEVPRDAPLGAYRLVVAAKRYRLESEPFAVGHSDRLTLVRREAPSPGRVAVSLAYPAAIRDRDLTYRPRFASGGEVRFRVDGRAIPVREHPGTKVFSVPAPPGASVTIEVARDRFGNTAFDRSLPAR